MYLKVRSKNETADALRRVIDTGKKRVVLRLGSMTPTKEVFPNAKNIADVIEFNTAEACGVSSNKWLMKKRFDEQKVITAEWSMLRSDWDKFPAIIKHVNSSRGNGIFYIKNEEELKNFFKEHPNCDGKYIIEKYYTYNREYRLHVTKDGCFYTCRKMLKRDAEDRWHRHDNNCVWILEENELFDKPSNWDEIEKECVKALQSVGLDIGAIDVKVQSSKQNKDPKFIILETNSAPSLGKITTIKYKEQLTKMVNEG